MKKLEDKADFLAPHPRLLFIIQRGDIHAIQLVDAGTGRSSRPIRFNSVDLPEPDGPMMETYSPAPMVRSTSPQRMYLLIADQKNYG